MIIDDTCVLCKNKPETIHHIIANCSMAANEGRYAWRHDSVLYTIANHLSQLKNAIV